MINRLSIIGAGEVGATIAYTVALRGLAHEIILVDKNQAKAKAQAADLSQGAMFLPHVNIAAGDSADCRGSDVIVITAGAKQAQGETRLQLTERNLHIMRDLVPGLTKAAPDALYLMVSNPVDILTYALLRMGVPETRAIGSGTVLDTSRFRCLLSRRLNVAVSSVHAYIVGEHGDSEVPLWSSSNISNVPLDKFQTENCPPLSASERMTIFDDVRNAAAPVIAAKGATNWAVGVAVARILDAIARDEQSVLTVSRYLTDYHGISDVCLSVPGLVNGKGLGPLIPTQYAPEELEALRRSANILRTTAAGIVA